MKVFALTAALASAQDSKEYCSTLKGCVADEGFCAKPMLGGTKHRCSRCQVGWKRDPNNDLGCAPDGTMCTTAEHCFSEDFCGPDCEGENCEGPPRCSRCTGDYMQNSTGYCTSGSEQPTTAAPTTSASGSDGSLSYACFNEFCDVVTTADEPTSTNKVCGNEGKGNIFTDVVYKNNKDGSTPVEYTISGATVKVKSVPNCHFHDNTCFQPCQNEVADGENAFWEPIIAEMWTPSDTTVTKCTDLCSKHGPSGKTLGKLTVQGSNVQCECVEPETPVYPTPYECFDKFCEQEVDGEVIKNGICPDMEIKKGGTAKGCHTNGKEGMCVIPCLESAVDQDKAKENCDTFCALGKHVEAHLSVSGSEVTCECKPTKN